MILLTQQAIKYSEGFEKAAAKMFKEPMKPLTGREEIVLYHIFTMYYRDISFRAFMTEAATMFSAAAANCDCPDCRKGEKDGT